MRKSVTSEIIISIIMFVLGLCLLVNGQDMMNLIIMLLGISLILYGVFNIITYFRFRLTNNPISNLIYGLIACVFGIILTINPNIISEIISFIFGVYILFISIPSLVDAIKYKDKVNNLSIGLSIAGIVIGILCLIGKFVLTKFIFQFVGLLLIIYGIINLINVILLDQGMNANKPKVFNQKGDIIEK